MPNEKNFTCVIEDHATQDRFSAEVTVARRRSVVNNRAELADIYITPISGQHFFYKNKET